MPPGRLVLNWFTQCDWLKPRISKMDVDGGADRNRKKLVDLPTWASENSCVIVP